jgi:hypothetical protein
VVGKQPYAVVLADRRLMAMAGLSKIWRSPACRLKLDHFVCAVTHNTPPQPGGDDGVKRWRSPTPWYNRCGQAAPSRSDADPCKSGKTGRIIS